ncbi:MAG TPA: serine/threonine-protein kinase, partial [Gemmataceae bacterium]|nr:serine/threonine-protein kinase [Gemmataceae bacterium]
HSTVKPPAAVADTAPGIPDLAPPPDYAFLGPAQSPEELGRLGPYRVLAVLGSGAMGIIFQAEDPQLKRRVALKVLKPSLAASYEFRRRFLREAQLAAGVDHEHVVTTYQVGEDRGVPFMAMQLLQGEPLEDRLRRSGGRLPLPEVLRIGREIAEGLTAAHAGGLVHRDIKPANVWLEAGRDRVKILDFGLARGTGEDAHWTQAGAVIGTPAYMAPEQANAEEVDARCDLFSLGALLYRASTGRLPFGDKDTLSILNALATKTPEAPHAVNPDLPPAFSALVMRLLAKDRAERPHSAQEVAQAIARLERGEVVEEVAPSQPEEVEEEPIPASEEEAPPEEEAEPVTARAVVRKKGRKKARPAAARRKSQPEEERDWGQLVLVVAIAWLAAAILVVLIAVLLHARRVRAAAPERATQTVRTARLVGAGERARLLSPAPRPYGFGTISTGQPTGFRIG